MKKSAISIFLIIFFITLPHSLLASSQESTSFIAVDYQTENVDDDIKDPDPDPDTEG